MTQILKQSTAVDVLIGPFLDLTDGATAETGESPTVKLSKNGQALAAKSDATTPVHDADGYYNCEFDATDTNTVGTLVLSVAKSANALPVRHEFQVVEEAVYDDLYGASAVGYPTAAEVVDEFETQSQADPTGFHVNVKEFNGTAQTANDVGADVDAILADTNELQTDWVNGGRLDLLIDAIKAVTDLLTAAHSEPTGVPAANETPLDKLAYLYMALRNKVTVTATKKTFYDDSDAAEWEKDLSDDGTTYTETEGNAI